MQPIVIFGEVLFDCFPNGKQVLGGAPFNIAWNLQAFGVSPLLISRVGEDSLGEHIQQAMHDWGLSLAGMQVDAALPTGMVNVTFVEQEPHYEIVYPSAYDAIAIADLPPIPADSLLYHGTLALRDPAARATFQHLQNISPASVFMDVNLRDPWWQPAEVFDHLAKVKWIKLNEAELTQLVPQGKTIQACMQILMAEYALEALIVTRGKQGAIIAESSGEIIQVTPPKVSPVVDTVGAGDGFSSVILLGLLKGWPWSKSLERAQEFASAIVGIQGATTLEKGFYDAFLESWHELL